MKNKNLLSEEKKRMQELSGIKNEYYLTGPGGVITDKSDINDKLKYRINELETIIYDGNLEGEGLEKFENELGEHINKLHELINKHKL